MLTSDTTEHAKPRVCECRAKNGAIDSVSSGKCNVVYRERQWWDEVGHDGDVQQPLDPNDEEEES